MNNDYKTKLLPKEKVFRDPIHGYIHVQHQLILDLINTKEVQRLRRVKQLGTTSFTFAGGEHSRFTHSLGVYELTRQICDIFSRDYPISKFEGGWDDSERMVALCAALLHDVGHGPYSHTFEGIFGTDHEEFTAAIITSPETEVFQVLQKVSPDFPEAVASVISHEYPNPQVVQMISSQIDADRMDYLLRDSYYTGTEYGKFDITRIMRVIRPYKDGIAFTDNGMNAVEDYIMSRYQMYMQVYFHHTSRGMEMILKHVLHYAAKQYNVERTYFDQTSPLLVPFFTNNYSLEDYLRLDDSTLNYYISMWQYHDDITLSHLAKRFINRKPLTSVKLNTNMNTDKVVQQLQEHVTNVGYTADIYTAVSKSYDLPYDVYRPDMESPRTQIELMSTTGELFELSTQSPIVKALSGELHGDERFYFPKEMLQYGYNLYEDDFQQFQLLVKSIVSHNQPNKSK